MPKRSIVLAVLACCALNAAAPVRAMAAADADSVSLLRQLPPDAYRFPTARDRTVDWLLATAGPSALAGDACSAAWSQWVTDEPSEWSVDGRGFAHRFGVAEATTAISETSFALLAAACNQDVRYYRSARAGLRPRLAHALRMTFTARARDGHAVFSLAKTVAPFAGPLVTRTTLFPKRYTLADGAVSGACGLAINAGWNLAREFVLPAPRW